MRTKLMSALFFAISLAGAFATSFSETNNGIYIAISGSSTNEVVASDDSLAWHPYCSTTTDGLELNYPDPAYGMRLSMCDEFGNPVQKTKSGKNFGSKFDQMKSYSDIVPPPRVGYSSSHIGSIQAQGTYDSSSPVSGPFLPSLQDLFQIEKPGNYTLEIQMQMFLIHKNTNQWTRQLIRFSPIKIKVKKPSQ